MRIKVKEDTADTKKAEVKKEVTKIKKEGTRMDADDLFDPLQSLVLEYLGDKVNLSEENNHQEDDKCRHGDVKDHLINDKEQIDIQKRQSHPNSYKFQSRLTLLGNITALYTEQTTQIAHNLLWHIDVDETLEFARENPAALLIPFEIKDPHGQRVKGTPLQIVAAAGDRNPRKLVLVEKDYGLVERLRSCFPKDSKEYDRQLEEWFRPDSKNEQTNKTMAPYVEAINILCQEIITSTEIPDKVQSDEEFQALLKLPIAEKFRKALTPDPNHVVTSGFLFDLQIFLDFFDIWIANNTDDKVKDKTRPNLGLWNSVKSALFSTIVYPALQARTQRIDLEIFEKGIGHVVYDDLLPDPINFSKSSVLADFSGLGSSFFFGFYNRVNSPPGEPWKRVINWTTYGNGRYALEVIMSSKNVGNLNYAAPKSSDQAGVR